MRYKFFVLLIILAGAGWAQQSSDTILKMQTEQDLAARLENQLYPFVGKTVVLVDLELVYPTNLVQAFGMDLDERESLPGLPVSRSTTAVLPQGTEKHNQVKIISRKITIYVEKKTKQDVIDFVHKQVSSWYNITEEKSDLLTISPILEPIKNSSIRSSVIIFGIMLTFILLLLTVNIKSALLYLAKSVKSTKISGFDKPLQVKGNMGGSSLPPGFQSSSSLKINDKKPIPIRIIQDLKESSAEIDFSFLEELSMDSFHKLVMACKPENIAFVLGSLSPLFLRNLYLDYPNLGNRLITTMLNSKTKTKPEMREIQKEIYNLYLDLNEHAVVEHQGFTALINLINILPNQESKKLLNDIKTTDAESADRIREKIFLLEDILTLDDDTIEEIYRNISHDLLVSFLASVEDNIKLKVLASMTPRAQMILEEDIQIIDKLSEEDKVTAIHEMLITIRTTLKY